MKLRVIKCPDCKSPVMDVVRPGFHAVHFDSKGVLRNCQQVEVQHVLD